MAEAHLKARVFTETTPAGFAWTYEIFDPAKPEGHQLTISGMRPTWSHAMETACQFLGRYAQTRRMMLRLLERDRALAAR